MAYSNGSRRKAQYYYHINGLNVVSEIYFPELIAKQGHDDNNIDIKWGDVPVSLKSITSEGEFYQATENEFLLRINGVARFLIKDNSKVVIDAAVGSDESEIRLYVLSTILGILLYKNNILGLHASCIKIGDRAVLISGHSGAGKSTTALGMHRRGYEIFSDDISAVFLKDNSPYVYPGYMYIKLWKPSLDAFGLDTKTLQMIRPNIEKYRFPIKRTNQEPLPLASIIFIRSNTEISDIECKQIDGLTSFEYLQRNTFRQGIIKDLGKTPSYFSIYSQIAAHIPLYSIKRPESFEATGLVDYIENLVLHHAK